MPYTLENDILIFEDGVNQGAVGVIDFLGTAVTAGVVGGTATVSVGGGGGGGAAISAAGASASNGTVVFSNSNNVSFGMAGSTVTATATVTQSNQNAVASNGNFNFQTISFSNANGLSFGTSAGSAIFGSYTVPTVTNSSMTVSDAATSGTLARLAFTNLNGVTLSLSTGAGGSHTIVGSHNGLTSQSNQNITAGNGGFAFQTLSFSNLNNISFGTSAGSAITASYSQSNQQMTMFATGNTTQSSTGTTNASSLIFNGAGIASVGITGGSVVISVPAGAPSPVNFSAGTTSNNLGSVVFADANNVVFGLNGSTITALAPILFSAGTTSGFQTNMTFSDSNGVSFGLNGAVITASVNAGGGGFTAPGYHPYDDFMQVVGQVGQGTLQFDPQVLPNISFDRLGFVIQNTNSSNSSGSHTLSFWVGLYTRNAATLSLYTSWSGSTAVTHSGTAGSYSRYSGGRLLALTVGATSIPENRYWIGFVSRTTSGGANGSYSNYMVSNINSQFTGLFGTASNATHQNKLGQGYYTATTSGIPNSVAFSEINGTHSLARRMPIIGFHSSTA